MEATVSPSLFQQCDFCKVLGEVGVNLFNKEGWYFCKPCLLEVEYELKRRKAEQVRN